MAEITTFTAARTLQGEEVRSKLTSEFAELFHDLDLGFQPINFMLPWAPLPHNRKRDIAHARMRAIYLEIIQARREASTQTTSQSQAPMDKSQETDMISNLMNSIYRDGTPVPDKEIAHMMITLLMAGQHSSSAISCWIILRLASNPSMTEKLYKEQIQNLGSNLPPLSYKDLDKLPLHHNVIKETLRIHSSIHTLMRKVKNPLPVPGTEFVIPPSHTLLSSPGVTARDARYFRDPLRWDPHRWEGRVEGGEEGDEEDTVDYGYGAVSKGTRSPYLPFGAGRHRCIGEKFAYLNLEVIVATLVRRFRFFNIEGVEEVPDTDYSVCIFVWVDGCVGTFVGILADYWTLVSVLAANAACECSLGGSFVGLVLIYMCIGLAWMGDCIQIISEQMIWNNSLSSRSISMRKCCFLNKVYRVPQWL